MSGFRRVFFFSSRRRHTRLQGDWSSDVCSSDLRFPPGLSYRNAFSNADPVNASIQEVLKTLLEAILLVVLVMFLFLQSVRITLIPLRSEERRVGKECRARLGRDS